MTGRRRVLVAMSGGVDSSVAAALLRDAGHDVTGVTLRLWGGDSDSGCCSVADVDDARRAAAALGIDHLVFGFGEDFERHVVEPYVRDHALGRTPNPCIECNRHLKFDRLWARARALGFDAIATGHHARVAPTPAGARLARGADAAKDQSYVLWVVPPAVLERTMLPVGDRTKAEVRALAADLGLRVADKPDSQDVCFITRTDGRERFLRDRLALRPAAVVDERGAAVGAVAAAELVTVGQRHGLGVSGTGSPRYALAVDPVAATVTVGGRERLVVDRTHLHGVQRHDHLDGPLLAQTSAHGRPRRCRLEADADDARAVVRWDEPTERVAPGQSVVLYRDDVVVGGGVASSEPPAHR